MMGALGKTLFTAGLLIAAAGLVLVALLPANAVDVEGFTLDGMAFTLYDGRVLWDAAGSIPAVTCAPVPGMVAWWAGQDNAQDEFGVNNGTAVVGNASYGAGISFGRRPLGVQQPQPGCTWPFNAASRSSRVATMTSSTASENSMVNLCCI